MKRRKAEYRERIPIEGKTVAEAVKILSDMDKTGHLHIRH